MCVRCRGNTTPSLNVGAANLQNETSQSCLINLKCSLSPYYIITGKAGSRRMQITRNTSEESSTELGAGKCEDQTRGDGGVIREYLR